MLSSLSSRSLVRKDLALLHSAQESPGTPNSIEVLAGLADRRQEAGGFLLLGGGLSFWHAMIEDRFAMVKASYWTDRDVIVVL